MKKLYEKKIRELTVRLQNAQRLLSVRKNHIRELQEEISGKDELISILSAYLCEGVCERGRVEIDRDKIGEGLKTGYTIDVQGKTIILERK